MSDELTRIRTEREAEQRVRQAEVALDSPGAVLVLMGQLYAELDRLGPEWSKAADRLRHLDSQLELLKAQMRRKLKDPTAPRGVQTVEDLSAEVLDEISKTDLYMDHVIEDAKVAGCEAYFKVLDRQIGLCQSAIKLLLRDTDERPPYQHPNDQRRRVA